MPLKSLFLGPDTSPILAHMRAHMRAHYGAVHATADPITTAGDWHLIVSHNYRHIVPRDLCEAWRGRAINCHTSALPWNRGAHPNLWAWVDGTPHGVTIHALEPGLDTGAIVAQRIIVLPRTGTLRTSYDRLAVEMAELFVETLPRLPGAIAEAVPQQGRGTYHRAADADAVDLPHGWDTLIEHVIGARSS